MKTFVRRLCTDESGVTAIEYGLIAALVAVAITAGIGTFSENLETLFNDIASQLNVDVSGGGKSSEP